jgi:hypothetical protein
MDPTRIHVRLSLGYSNHSLISEQGWKLETELTKKMTWKKGNCKKVIMTHKCMIADWKSPFIETSIP